MIFANMIWFRVRFPVSARVYIAACSGDGEERIWGRIRNRVDPSVSAVDNAWHYTFMEANR